MSSLRERWLQLRSTLAPGVNLLAVSKTFSSDLIQELYQYGQRDFGENKVQELSAKAKELRESCPEIRWHFIGHLQTNKIKQLLEVSQLVAIHSIDSIELWSKLSEKSSLVSHSIDVFIQVKVSGEEEKFGFGPDLAILRNCADLMKKIPDGKFKLRGLMAMGAIRTDDQLEAARVGFATLKRLRDDLDQSLELSMGMSQDYLVAQEFGTNWVRVGTSLFGGRVL